MTQELGTSIIFAVFFLGWLVKDIEDDRLWKAALSLLAFSFWVYMIIEDVIEIVSK